MKKLSMYPVAQVDQLAWPDEFTQYSLWSAATGFLTDFSTVQPLVIEATVSAQEARTMMLKTHVRLMFVINAQDEFIGVISADDVAERKIVQKVAEGFERNDIAVTDLMTPKKELRALTMNDVAASPISSVIDLLKDSHQQHCLVIDPAAHKVRGIFSASDISRKLKLPIDIQQQSDFYRVFSAIA